MIRTAPPAGVNMTDLLTLDFFRNALIMSVLLAVLFGILSFIVVMRKMSFLGAGISHTAFGGIALGVLTGIDPFLCAVVFCVISALLIGKLTRIGKISYDASIGIFFAFSMAVGAVFIALKKGYTFDLMGYLFGNILAIGRFDIYMALTTLVLFMPFIAVYLHRIIFMSFDEEVAAINGVPVEFIDTILLIYLAALIVVSIKFVGIILVSALVVLPASFGLALSRNFRQVILIGVIYTLGILTGGLFLSYFFDLPAGATMVSFGTLFYFMVLALKKFVFKE
jgi:zinc transport system permease protein